MFTHFWIARFCTRGQRREYGYIGWMLWLLATAILGFSCEAQAHGIVGAIGCFRVHSHSMTPR